MPRPSLVTSSGPSPVRGFIAAIRHPLSCLGAAGTSRGLRHLLRFLAGPASHNHVDQYLYYPEFRPAVLTISVPAGRLAVRRVPREAEGAYARSARPQRAGAPGEADRRPHAGYTTTKDVH